MSPLQVPSVDQVWSGLFTLLTELLLLETRDGEEPAPTPEAPSSASVFGDPKESAAARRTQKKAETDFDEIRVQTRSTPAMLAAMKVLLGCGASEGGATKVRVDCLGLIWDGSVRV